MVSKKKVLLVLFLPFVCNFTISMIIGCIAARRALAEGVPYEKIGQYVMVTLFTYNFYWSILQIAFGL